jgi:hypothetical protein
VCAQTLQSDAVIQKNDPERWMSEKKENFFVITQKKKAQDDI